MALPLWLLRLLRPARVAAGLGAPFLLGWLACLVFGRKKKIEGDTRPEPPAKTAAELGESPVAFLNVVIKQLWPHVNDFIRTDIIHKTVQPLLQKALPGLTISKFSLGSGSPPTVDAIKAERYQRRKPLACRSFPPPTLRSLISPHFSHVFSYTSNAANGAVACGSGDLFF